MVGVDVESTKAGDGAIVEVDEIFCVDTGRSVFVAKFSLLIGVSVTEELQDEISKNNISMKDTAITLFSLFINSSFLVSHYSRRQLLFGCPTVCVTRAGVGGQRSCPPGKMIRHRKRRNGLVFYTGGFCS